MDFQVIALDAEPFATLFGLDESTLAARGVRRLTAHVKPGSRFPCRVSLRDAVDGESVLLLSHEDMAMDTPYRSRFAIYVREGAASAQLAPNELPEVMLGRPLALRAYSAEGMLLRAELAQDEAVAPMLRTLLATPGVAFVHAHNVRHGCFVARVEQCG